MNALKMIKHQTTMFMNKYCVANTLEDMNVDYEMVQKVSIEDDCDFEVDDEIVTEDFFFTRC